MKSQRGHHPTPIAQLKHFLHLLGAPFDPKMAVNKAVSNIICCLVFGKRFEYTEKRHQSVLEDFTELMYLEGQAGAQVSPVLIQVQYVTF